jgi:hypothetical protein
MRMSSGLVPLSLTMFAGFFLAAIVLLSSDPGFAQGRPNNVGAIELPPAAPDGNATTSNSNSNAGTCTCSNGAPPASNSGPIDPQQRDRLWPKPALADLKATLDDSDAIAALEAVQLALSEVGDGATYVWHRRHGRLSGAIQPTSSFKDQTGHVCRHIVMALTSGSYSRKAEGIACRMRDGVWVLEG